MSVIDYGDKKKRVDKLLSKCNLLSYLEYSFLYGAYMRRSHSEAILSF